MALSDEDKMAAKEQYFQEVVTPKIPKESIEDARAQFFGQQQVRSQPGAASGPDGQQMAWRQDRPVSRMISNFARPVLEGGGAVGGAVLGTPAGPIGQAGGAGLGYAMGANVADKLEALLGVAEHKGLSESAGKAASDVATGTSLEMGGQLIAKGVQGLAASIVRLGDKYGLGELFGKIKKGYKGISDEGVLEKAREALTALRAESPEVLEEYAKRGTETDELLKRLGVKTVPTSAQRTGSVKQASFEHSMSARDPDVKAALSRQDAMIRQEALDTLKRQYPEGSGAGDVIAAVESDKKAMDWVSGLVRKQSAEAELPLGIGKSQQEVGREIYEALSSNNKTIKKAVGELFDTLPQEMPLSGQPVADTAKRILDDFKTVGGGAKSFPTSIYNQIKKATSGTKDVPWDGNITFAQLRDWRSQVGEEIRDAMTGANPNRKLARRLEMLKGGIDDALDQMGQLGGESADAAQQYLNAKKAFSEYAGIYRKGSVGQVLQKGDQPYGGKLPFSEIPARFFATGKLDAADELLAAVGKDDAKKIIKDYANQSLLAADRGGALSGEMKSGPIAKWISANKDVLKKYGLYDDYVSVLKEKKLADVALENMDMFNKTAATKILNSDVDKVIERVFSGADAKNSASVMQRVLQMPGIEGNPAAIQGLQAAMKDHFVAAVQIAKKDALDNPMASIGQAQRVFQKLSPAMEVLYKDAPQKLQALKDYHKLLDVLARNKNVTYAGGSTTVEKLVGGSAPREDSILSNLAQLAAIKAGKGWFFSSSKRLVQSIFRGAEGQAKEQIDEILKRAIFDPEIAETLMGAASGKMAKAAVEKRMRSHMITLGLYSGKKAAEIITDEE